VLAETGGARPGARVRVDIGARMRARWG